MIAHDLCTWHRFGATPAGRAGGSPTNDHVPGPLLGVRRFPTKETVGDHGRTRHQIDSGALEWSAPVG